MRESELLSHIAERSRSLAARFPHVLVGPGDDAAVVRTPNGDQLLLTVDHLVEGRHFEALDLANGRWMIDLIARKAIARSVSDIAAMGGTPMCALATACLPPGFPQDAADALFDAMQKWSEHWKCPLVGGDLATTSAARPGPMVLTTTVVGLPHKSGAVLRSGAREDDGVWVTGTLGGSLREQRHLLFEPRIAEARWLCDEFRAGQSDLHAMMDLSDGLGRDAARLGVASGLRLEIDATRLPCRAGSDWRSALSDGEDYELLFTMDGGVGTRVPMPERCPATGTAITRIGTVVRGADVGETPEPARDGLANVPWAGCIVRTPEGTWIDAAEWGWEHGEETEGKGQRAEGR